MIVFRCRRRIFATGTRSAGTVSCKGFTLIELMLAITIFAMVIGVLFNAFSVGISAWQGGERDIVFHQSMRSATELVFQEINAAYPYTVTPGDLDTHKDFSAFLGSPESLSFVSRATLQNRIGGLSLIEIWVDDENGLMLAEAPALFTTYDELVDMDLRTDEYAEVLSPWVKKISFRYFQLDDEEEEEDGGWQDQWDPRNMDDYDLPVMVEVALVFEDVREQEFEQVLLVPIMGRPF